MFLNLNSAVLIPYAFIVLFFVLTLLIIFTLRSKRKLKQANILLSEKNKEISAQREKIQKQKDRITQKTIDLIVLNRELKETSLLREGLTNMIIHDLKNPISNIISLSNDNEVSFFAKQLLTMVDNILDIQKYEGMVMPLNIKPVFLYEISENAINEVSYFAAYKNIELKNNVLSDIFVKADADILKRVFVNLLSNAVKYSHKNGTVKIECERNTNKKDTVIIKIIDNGIGIAKEKIPLIFNKFSQIIARKTGEARSTGIGLTFCKMAVEAHGSSITVRSVPGRFTEFAFGLPVILSQKSKDIRKTAQINESIIFNEDELDYLSTFYQDFKRTSIYEISELRKIINKIDQSFSLNIKNWKNKMSEAVYNCNSDLYNKLTEQIKKQHL